MMIKLPVGDEGHSDWSGFVFLLALIIASVCLIEASFITLFVVSILSWNLVWQIFFGILVIIFPLIILKLR